MTRLQIIALLEQVLADVRGRVGPHDWNDPTWHARNRAEYQALADRLTAECGARIREDFNGVRVSMAGVTSTSTSGLPGALSNWTAAARRKEAVA